MERNNLTSFENLCRIFEMRIKLDKEKGIKTPIEVIENYEKYSKKIDVIYNNEFQKALKPLISPAITLEKEKERLRRLIKLLEERLSKRIELEDSFYETTGKYLSGLQIIVSDYELEDKKERLSLISRYLETRDEIESVSNSINELNKELDEEERKLVEYEIKNKIIEDELYTTFMKIINTDEYFKSINALDINGELDKIKESVREAKETLDITKDSIGSLVTNGLEDDYASYIEEAEKNYYSVKNKEIILQIYKLVADFEDDFKLICAKREKIIELLNEKKEIGSSLVLDVDNELLSFEKIVTLQNNTLDNERETIDNITNYNSRINFKEERLEELKEVNSAVEILSILREYGIIETYDTEEVLQEEKEEISIEGNDFFEKILDTEEDKEETIVEEFYDPYRIVEISDYPKTLNVGLAKLKGESVREKVNKKLNPKEEKKINIEEIINNLESDITKSEAEQSNVQNMDSHEVVMESSVLEENNDKTETVNVPNIELLASEENKKQEETPVWDIPSEIPETNNGNNKSEENNTLPVWNLEDTNSEDNKSSMEAEMPVWELPTEITDTINDGANMEEISTLPVWGEININDNKSNISEEIKEEDNNNLFWLPVSDTKVNSGGFPSLNIPVNSSQKKDSNFVFPTINN